MPINPEPTTSENRLLKKLPAAELDRLQPHLKLEDLEINQILYDLRGPIDTAYFPGGAVLSALMIMQDGNAIEVATVGREGLIGHTALQGSAISPNRMIVQIPGKVWRISVDALAREANGCLVLRGLLIRYQVAFLAQVSQSVACNGLHRLEQRCCCWLLMSRDRLGSDDLRLTQEFLAIMLGARRASVTETLKPLQEANLVRSYRGQISILDGAGLEERACECYQMVKDEYDRLLGVS